MDARSLFKVGQRVKFVEDPLHEVDNSCPMAVVGFYEDFVIVHCDEGPINSLGDTAALYYKSVLEIV